MGFWKWQNGCAHTREIEAAECQLCAGHPDILGEGEQVIIRHGGFLKKGPAIPDTLWRREIAAIPKERKA
jgi:hypothetical protein